MLGAISACPFLLAFALTAPVVEVSSSLPTGGADIRQFAFDGDETTQFVSASNARAGDTLTFTFDPPVSLRSVSALAGRADGSGALDAGALEVSADGSTFEALATFEKGTARREDAGGKTAKALRVKVAKDLDHPLIVRELKVASDPPVAPFAHPVEIAAVSEDAPELKEWAESTARACERAYPMICEELKSEGDSPARQITMTLKSTYKGVAMAGGTRITGSVDYFKGHKDDVGAMVHETTHVVQRYRGRGNPSWLVEGVADYIRFFKYEPGKIGKIDPRRARYDASYRTTAAFLAYASERYDKDLVRKLNAAMRAGTYKEELFKEYTGKTVQELGEEWKRSLQAGG